MNHLAHTYLADRTGHSILGTLLADYLRGRIAADWEAEIRRGIRIHRALDTFTDAHPVTARSRGRLRPPHRRFGGVLVDIFYDHFLARSWAEWTDEPLAAFSERVGALLAADRERLPPRLGRFLDYMLAERLFVSYREPAGIDRALRGIALRSRRAAPLRTGVRELERTYDGLREDFRAFFPQVVAKAEDLSRRSGGEP
jgi:acyl carrier protein phosphodiesterase